MTSFTKAREAALLNALWGAVEAQDISVHHADDFTQIDGFVVEREQLAFNLLARLRAAGFAVVPREPTSKMRIAGNEYVTRNPEAANASGVWRAMLAAAETEGK